MEEIGISKGAQVALVKLLSKLNLIDSSVPNDRFDAWDYCPIAWFARAKFFDETDAISVIAEKLGIPAYFVSKADYQKLISLLEHPNLSKIALDKWKALRTAPISLSDSGLTVAMSNPLDTDAKQFLEFELGLKVAVVIAPESQILAILAKSLSSSELFNLDSIIHSSDILQSENSAGPVLPHQESNVFTADHTAAPIVRLVNKILSDGIELSASDIHLDPEKDGLKVRYRVDGMMSEAFIVPANLQAATITRIKVLAGMDIAERRRPQDGRLRAKTAHGVKDLRISVLPTIHGENVVARILSSELPSLSFASLGMKPELEQLFSRALKSSSRVVLVTGPTGSGKTSTLYAALLHLRDGTNNIITIEDPIEYKVQGVTQIQVNDKIGLSFSVGLSSILRQDPDIVMVGEVRDRETAEMAMQSAQTGHLVMSTLHTNTAASAITRLLDLGIPAYLVASSLGCVVAQRLARKLCSCAAPVSGVDLERCQTLGLDPSKIRSRVGCAECDQTGFKGRIGIYSMLHVTDAVREAIRTTLSEKEIEARAAEGYFKSLGQSGLELVEDGTISLEELERTVGTVEGILEERSAQKFSSQTTSIKSGSTGLHKRKVLLVEDDSDTRTVLSMLLQSEMFEVTEAENGAEGLRAVFENPPEIILCDLMMPKMDGLQLTKKLRSDVRTRKIPVLILTAADTEDNELKLLDSGADDFISKTSDAKILIARVHRLLDRAPH